MAVSADSVTERTPHSPHLPAPDLGKAFRWMKDHPLQTVSIAVVTIGGPALAISLYIGYDKNPQLPPAKPPLPAAFFDPSRGEPEVIPTILLAPNTPTPEQPSPSATATATEPPLPTETPTKPPATPTIPSPRETPTSVAGYSAEGNQLVYREKDIKLNVPQLEGARAVLKGDKVVYQAEKGNPYGVEAGIELGEFVKNVFVEGKQTGALALIPEAVLYIYDQEIAKDTNPKDKWRVVSPVDFSALLKDGKTTITIGKSPTGVLGVLINFDGKSPLVNTIKNSTHLSVRYLKGVFRYIDSSYGTFNSPVYSDAIRLQGAANGNYINPTKPERYVTIMAKQGQIESTPPGGATPSSFGDIIGEAEGFVLVGHAAAIEIDNTELNKLLTYKDLPVSIRATGSSSAIPS